MALLLLASTWLLPGVVFEQLNRVVVPSHGNALLVRTWLFPGVVLERLGLAVVPGHHISPLAVVVATRLGKLVESLRPNPTSSSSSITFHAQPLAHAENSRLSQPISHASHVIALLLSRLFNSRSFLRTKDD
jgi:hypothetical protein